MSRTIAALAFSLAFAIGCSNTPPLPSPTPAPSGPIAHVAGSWVGTLNELECGPPAIGNCYIWRKIPPPHVWQFTMQLTEDAMQVGGSFARLDDQSIKGTVTGQLRPGNRVELVITLRSSLSVTVLNNFNVTVAESGDSLDGMADYVLGSETRRSEVKALRSAR